MTRVLVTGASGFVGLSLTRTLADAGYTIRAASRHPAGIPPHTNVSTLVLPDLAHPAPWEPFLADVDAVINQLAGVELELPLRSEGLHLNVTERRVYSMQVGPARGLIDLRRRSDWRLINAAHPKRARNLAEGAALGGRKMRHRRNDGGDVRDRRLHERWRTDRRRRGRRDDRLG